jgi:hypothetical protein
MRELEDAYEMASEHQVFDQIASVMELLHRLRKITRL